MTATKEQIRNELIARREVGRQMSNFCFNVAQDGSLPKRYRETMDKMRRDWDAIQRVDIGTARRRAAKEKQ